MPNDQASNTPKSATAEGCTEPALGSGDGSSPSTGRRQELAVQLHLAERLLGDPASMSPALSNSISGLTPEQLSQALAVSARLLILKAKKRAAARSANPGPDQVTDQASPLRSDDSAQGSGNQGAS